MTAERFMLVALADLPPGAMQAFDAGGRRILVCNVDGAIHAVDELCPHLAVPLGQGTLRGAEVTCPGHGSVFDVVAGTCTRWVGRKPGALARLLSSNPTPPAKHAVVVVDDTVFVDIS